MMKTSNSQAAGRKTTFLATGDSFMTRRLPEGGYEGYQELRQVIMNHEVRFNNLEITIHRQEGFPAAVSGGTWAMAEPEILKDLQSFGFNLFNTANNHSGDYSHGGILATIRYLREYDALFAGTGANLAEASAAAYLETKTARVALLGVCSTFDESHAAGNQSMYMVGRPGLNPLHRSQIMHVEKPYFNLLGEIAEKTCLNAEMNHAIKNGYAQPLPEDRLNFGGLNFKCSTVNQKCTEPSAKDMSRTIRGIQEAKRQADYVLVSIHSHEFDGETITEPAGFIRDFCHACIDAGADAVLGHGPHELRGIEIYKGKVIFYSLGNFIFETETVSLQPADAFENSGMAQETLVGEYIDVRSKNSTRGYVVQENIWRSVMAGFTAVDGEITEVQLYPITLDQALPRSRRGCPRLQEEDAVSTLEYLAELSEPFGTQIEIRDHVGVIRLK